ncbi:hypothetical protein CD116_11195, partial [Staphylococcus schweitzeri]
PNIEAGEKSAYNNVQVGVGRRNEFCENIISVPLPSNFSNKLNLNDHLYRKYFDFIMRLCKKKRVSLGI